MLWNFGDGGTSTDRMPTHLYTSNGPFTVTLTIDNLFTLRKQIFGRSMAEDFDIIPISTACSNNQFGFYYPNHSCADVFAWDFGNGITSTATFNSSITFVPGIYTVKLTLDSRVTVTKELRVGQAFANFTYTSATTNMNGNYLLLAGLPVNFVDNSLCATSFSWDFGDGTTSTERNPSKRYNSEGVYTVKLYINNNPSIKMERRIYIGCGKAVNIAVTNITPSAATLNWTSSAPISSYMLHYRKATETEWTIVANVTPPYRITGLAENTKYYYSIFATCNGAITSIAFDPQSFFITSTPCSGVNAQAVSVSFSATGAPCTGSSLQLFASNLAGCSYQWTGPNNFYSSLQNPIIVNSTALNNGTYNCVVLSNGCQVAASSVTVAIAVTPPIPASNSTSTIKGNSAILSWTTIAGTNVDLQYKSSMANNWTTITNAVAPYTVSGLTTSTSYYWQVRASRNGCYSNWSGVNIFTTSADCDPPASSTVSGITNSSAMITWPVAGNGVTGYLIYYRVNSTNGVFTTAGTATGGNVGSVTYNLLNLLPGVRYDYRIVSKCVPTNQPSSIYQGGTFTTLDCALPTVGVNTITTTTAKLNWTNVSGISRFKLEYRELGASAFQLISSSYVGVSYNFTNLLPGKTYEYKLTPLCGPANAAGINNVVGSFTTLSCSAPSNAAVLSVSPTTASLSWLKPAPVNACYLEYRPTGANNYTVVNNYISSNSYTIPGLVPGNSYDFRLSPVCGLPGTSPYPNPVTGTFQTANQLCYGGVTRTACTGTISDGSGGNNYSNNLNCNWLIYVTGATFINLRFKNFSTEAGKDIVKVYKGSSAIEANLVGVFSGTTIPPDIIVSGCSMYITFQTNSTNATSGWDAQYYSSFCMPPALGNQLVSEPGKAPVPKVNSINLYPNPYIDNITISMELELEDVTLLLTDENGQIVYKKFYHQMERLTHIDFGVTLKPADYILTIRDENDIKFRQKLINQQSSITKAMQIDSEQLQMSEISLYPNPYIDNITILMKRELNEVAVLLMDLEGRVVFRKDFSRMNVKTNLDFGRTLPAGVYFIVIRNNQEILFRKRVVAQK